MSSAQVERAIYAATVSTLRHMENGYSRVYFGNEFCQRLMPSAVELEDALGIASEWGRRFTFLTPYLTDAGLKQVEPLLMLVAERLPGSEVVFNDWGVFKLISRLGVTLRPVMGRLLIKMKRGPRLMTLFNLLPGAGQAYYRGSNLGVPAWAHYLVGNGVQRVELDNVLQGLDVDLGGSGINASLYVPYAYVTTTRYCAAISCDTPDQEEEIGIRPCRRECREYSCALSHPVMPVSLISKGNTKFLRNDEIPDDLARIGVDRLVFEPDIPL